jgi:hypothetical protein
MAVQLVGLSILMGHFKVISDRAGRAGGGEVVVVAVGVVEGGVGERVMVMSMATREMGCGGGFLKEEGLGVKPTSAGHLVQPSMCVSNESYLSKEDDRRGSFSSSAWRSPAGLR